MIPALISATALTASVLLSPVPGGVAVTVAGRPFTTYRFANSDGTPLRRPYCYPVLADDGTPVTADQTVTGGDHPHHRSLWIGHGDVNGADHWATNDMQTSGPRQVPRGLPAIEGNALVQQLDWACGARCTMTEERRIEFLTYPDGSRAIDVTSAFTGAGLIRLGDTKEAGLVAVRVAGSISASPVITASSGCTGEPGCWGKPASWCDISGPVRGNLYGMAMLDHPENRRHPTRWHVRSYGLLAANPFGVSAFDKVPPGTGEVVIDPAAGALFRHRVIIHRGSAAAAAIAAKYDEFSGTANAPQIARAARLQHLDWKLPDPNPWWTIDGASITGRQDPENRGNVLETRQVFRDVVVELEYRYTGDVDSGIFLRAGQRWQCQIGISRSLRRDMTASIYDQKRMYVAEAKAAPALNLPGVWHRLRIEARGDRFRHWLDGRLVLDYSDPVFEGVGPIGLQLHGGVRDMQIEFRGVRVVNLADGAGLQAK